jgi:hypothetical protein
MKDRMIRYRTLRGSWRYLRYPVGVGGRIESALRRRDAATFTMEEAEAVRAVLTARGYRVEVVFLDGLPA